MSQVAKIGQVAQETGLSIDTIRFYEKQGLLRRSARTEGGFRLFGSDEIQALKFVRKAQELGFSLNEAWRTASSLNSRLSFLRGEYSIEHLLRASIAPIKVSIKRGYFHFSGQNRSFEQRVEICRDRTFAPMSR